MALEMVSTHKWSWWSHDIDYGIVSVTLCVRFDLMKQFPANISVSHNSNHHHHHQISSTPACSSFSSEPSRLLVRRQAYRIHLGLHLKGPSRRPFKFHAIIKLNGKHSRHHCLHRLASLSLSLINLLVVVWKQNELLSGKTFAGLLGKFPSNFNEVTGAFN